MTEGISIPGANQFHILEPMLSYAQQQQLVERVSRYESHTFLPIQQRKVHVYFWYASVSGIIQNIRKHISGMKQWIFIELNKNYFSRTLDYTQDATPDYNVKMNIGKLQNLADELKKNKRSTSNALVEKSKNKESCCIWEPDESKISECLQKHNKMCL
jgi:hypothetical protein